MIPFFGTNFLFENFKGANGLLFPLIAKPSAAGRSASLVSLNLSTEVIGAYGVSGGAGNSIFENFGKLPKEKAEILWPLLTVKALINE